MKKFISILLLFALFTLTMLSANISVKAAEIWWLENALASNKVVGEEGYVFLSEDTDGYNQETDSLLFYLIKKEAKNGQNGTVSVLNPYMRDQSGEIDFSLCQEIITVPEAVTISGLTYTVEVIESNAFYGKSVKSINLPDSITEIKPNAFSGSKIESFTIPKNLKKYDYILVHCYYLTEIVDNSENPNFTAKDNALYSKDLKTLYAVANNGSEYTVAEGVENIKRGAMMNMALEEVTMPKSLKIAEDDAFVVQLVIFKDKIPTGFNCSFGYALVPKGLGKYAKNLTNLDGKVVEKIPFLAENSAYLKKVNWSSKDALKSDSKLTTAQRLAIKKTAAKVAASAKTDIEKLNKVVMYISQNKTLDNGAIYMKNNIIYGIKGSYDFYKYNSTWGAYQNSYIFYEGAARLAKEMLYSLGIKSYMVKIYDNVIPTVYLISKINGVTYIYDLMGQTYGNYDERFYPVNYGYNIPLKSFSTTEKFVSIVK